MAQTTAYRRDIDGLRAIAVSLVILYHLNLPYFPGGYIGVDVFFVISGYLISSIIYREVSENRFSILRFYERRARRILPALMVVLALTSIVSAILLLPSELISYAKSLLAATFSFSNFYFWKTSNYFVDDGHVRPLLHTWSLAVEEQFYLVFPLLLLGLARFSKRVTKIAIVAIAVLSFIWWVYESYASSGSAFYLPMSRAWELLLGSMLAVFPLPQLRRPVREIGSALGLLLIAFAASPFMELLSFPGTPNVAGTIGAVLLIAAGGAGASLGSSLVSLRPVVFVGLISYSAYLWHYPLIVFAKMGLVPIQQPIYLDCVLFVAALVLGWLSWKYIEKPFRAGVFRTASRNQIFRATGIAALASTIVAVAFLANHGFESRFPQNARTIAAFIDRKQEMRAGKCMIYEPAHYEDFDKADCMRIDPHKKNYLLLGDSHAAALWFGLKREMPNVNVLQVTAAGCNPGMDTHGSRDCQLLKNYVFDDFLPTHRIDGLFVTANWVYPRQFMSFDNTIAWAQKHKLKVVVFGPVMQYDTALPRLLAYSIALRKPALPLKHERTYLFGLNAAVEKRAVEVWHVPFVSVMDVQCASAVCRPYTDASEATPMLVDEDHLSNVASVQIVQKVLPELDRVVLGAFKPPAKVTEAPPVKSRPSQV